MRLARLAATSIVTGNWAMAACTRMDTSSHPMTQAHLGKSADEAQRRTILALATISVAPKRRGPNFNLRHYRLAAGLASASEQRQDSLTRSKLQEALHAAKTR